MREVVNLYCLILMRKSKFKYQKSKGKEKYFADERGGHLVLFSAFAHRRNLHAVEALCTTLKKCFRSLCFFVPGFWALCM